MGNKGFLVCFGRLGWKYGDDAGFLGIVWGFEREREREIYIYIYRYI